MANNLSPRRRVEMYKGYLLLFVHWRYAWFVTLTYSGVYGGVSPDTAKRMVIDWVRTMQTQEGIQVGYMLALCYKGDRPHIHMLMNGRNARGKFLIHVDRARWERAWPHRAQIEAISSQYRVCEYMAAQFFKNDSCEISYYNTTLLDKYFAADDRVWAYARSRSYRKTCGFLPDEL